MAEAPLERTEHGLVPKGDGWFVVNAREARWFHMDELGSCTFFEGDPRFPDLGINVNVLQPGQPGAMYHAEGAQEDFLVIAGEGLVIVEGEERRLEAWDLFHSPPDCEHVLVGAGDGPFVYVAVGARGKGRRLRYPVNQGARTHDAGVERETTSPDEAYARFRAPEPAPYRDGDLPDG